MVRSKLLLVSGLLVAIPFVGQGCGSRKPSLVPVSGKVVSKETPFPNAEIVLHPQFEGPGWMPIASIQQDGTFKVATRDPGDGALPGKYKVTITWKPVIDHNGDGPNVLPPQYASPKTTPLEIDVQSQPANDFTLEIRE